MQLPKRKDAPGCGALAPESWMQMPAPALLGLFLWLFSAPVSHQVPSLPHWGAGRVNSSRSGMGGCLTRCFQ